MLQPWLRTSENAVKRKLAFRELWQAEIPRISLPRTPVNKGQRLPKALPNPPNPWARLFLLAPRSNTPRGAFEASPLHTQGLIFAAFGLGIGSERVRGVVLCAS